LEASNVLTSLSDRPLPLARWVLAASAFSVPLCLPQVATAADGPVHRLPNEYEVTSGHGVAMNNGGYAGNDAVSAIRANPALLPMTHAYTVSAGYHWPTVGRDFFQASVVDAKTSPIAAGVTYTGFNDDYRYALEDQDSSPYDSPVVRRGVLGAGQQFGNVAMGIGGTYVEGHTLWSKRVERDIGDERVRGFGLNAGIAGSVADGMMAGLSVENASNRKIKDYAPRTYRGGIAYAFTQDVRGFVDYRQRERVPEFEPAAQLTLDEPTSTETLPDEQMGIASLVAEVQDFLRLIASYGQDFADDRRSAAGGVAVVNKNFTLSYTVSRPYMQDQATHQAVALSLDIAM
jgi:hypothetical protein